MDICCYDSSSDRYRLISILEAKSNQNLLFFDKKLGSEIIDVDDAFEDAVAGNDEQEKQPFLLAHALKAKCAANGWNDEDLNEMLQVLGSLLQRQ